MTAEGLELTFALNHMAYFVLTQALRDEARRLGAGAHRLDRLGGARRAPSSISTTCNARSGYSGWRAYRRSKLGNILFTRELARRLAGTGVTANCLHPGFVASRFGDEAGGWTGRLVSARQALRDLAEEGADTIVYLASSPEVANSERRIFRQATDPEAVGGRARRRGGARAVGKERGDRGLSASSARDSPAPVDRQAGALRLDPAPRRFESALDPLVAALELFKAERLEAGKADDREDVSQVRVRKSS